MAAEPMSARELEGFDPGAVRAVELAGSEARELGHDRVGTEHLLLGLLANESDASELLAAAGVTRTAARSKVDEAVGAHAHAARRSTRGAERTPRATRALGRAARFARAAGEDLVTSRSLLLAVLDVEGTAGQVLRGLGVDVDALRHALDGHALDGHVASAASTPDASAPATLGEPRCPSCEAVLDELVARVVPARDGDAHVRDAVIFACPACGHPAGVTWHRAR